MICDSGAGNLRASDFMFGELRMKMALAALVEQLGLLLRLRHEQL